MKITKAVWIALVFTAAYCQSDHVERKTKLGKLRGNRLKILGNVIEEYVGIPYAEPPIGELRFKEPVPRSPWKGTYDATIGGSACPQQHILENAKKPLTYTEDCLHLNVWMPQNAQKSHVLVWIHGGGFNFGTASYEIYTGSVLAAKTGFVVVSINYRIGMLGFLNANSPDAPGNQGLLDQTLALKWVQDNIKAFGGDPSMVTIFGESAGGMSAHSHVLSPMSKGLFKRAVMMSGSMYTMDFFEVLAAKTGFVVVSINYRIGMLGFLNANSPDAPGNQGLLDQNLALKWVRDNIEAFGGEPSMVTIFGESAGGMSVHSHVLSPMSKGLFNRALMMSGSMYTIDFFESTHESIIKGNKVAQLVGCADANKDLVSHPEEALECLRSKKADELVLATTEVSDPGYIHLSADVPRQIFAESPNSSY
ncbi:hypothetical protein HPB47_023048 [Ixodes persulcatus]|uniref:Uncharacterized protein n=1 Tax=Ixodes persulcatus TaxID=34615 RepID=A0AC60Q8I3_IXOPE|nr:hypothetical protein HPB47_023048 [Ixodes persulcatus]